MQSVDENSAVDERSASLSSISLRATCHGVALAKPEASGIQKSSIVHRPSYIPLDSRAWLCQALLQYMERHPERRAVAQEIYDFVTAHTDCFCRTQKLGHITGSAWLLNPAGDKALLTLHHNLQRWMQLGGHSDGDPNTLAVALREATEESGIEGIVPVSPDIIDVDIHRIPDRPAKNEPAHWHYDIRFLMRAPHEHYRISAESDDLAWWSRADFAARAAELDEAVRRLAAFM